MIQFSRAMRITWTAASIATLAAGLSAAPAQTQDPAVLTHAKALMREVPLIDGHNDLPWEVRVHGLSFDSVDIAHAPDLMTDIPRLREGLDRFPGRD